MERKGKGLMAFCLRGGRKANGSKSGKIYGVWFFASVLVYAAYFVYQESLKTKKAKEAML